MSMTLLQIVRNVCGVVGVDVPDSIFSGIDSNRTMTEMYVLANEMAKRIAYDTREWTRLYTLATIVGDGVTSGFPLPLDYRRMALTTNVRRSDSPTMPLNFISDIDQWAERRSIGTTAAPGEWTLVAGGIDIVPVMPIGVNANFIYLNKNCIAPASGPAGAVTDVFLNDGDTYLLDDRVLLLGMIWQWKALKGSPYAEDMSNYETALARAAGADKPAPILVGRKPISSAALSPSYPFPV